MSLPTSPVEHTPTPWRIDENYTLVDLDGSLIAEFGEYCREEDAAFIVQATRAHDALVHMLKAAQVQLNRAAQTAKNELLRDDFQVTADNIAAALRSIGEAA